MKRILIIAVAIGTVIIASFVIAGPMLLSQWGRTARKNWKESAIPQIAQRAGDTNWTAQQIASVTNRAGTRGVLAEGWLTDSLILMENGEWLVYKSHCSKQKPRLVKDIFLAKGSDGKWYYSTFHFCVEMVALRLEQESQPPDLKMFVHEYNLREFDGASDECLKQTGSWPASWAEKSAQATAGPRQEEILR